MLVLPPISPVIACLSLLASLFNGLLLYLAYKIRGSSPDVQLVMAVAFVDLCCPLVINADFIYLLVTGNLSSTSELACQIYGLIYMAYPMVAAALASALAIRRYLHISQIEVSWWAFSYPAVLYLIYFIMSCFAAYRYEFLAAPSIVHCQIFPATSVLSACIFFLVDSVIFLGTVVTIYFYFKIAIFTVRTNHDILMVEASTWKSEFNSNFAKPKSKVSNMYYFRSVALRLGTIISLYTIFMLPASIFFILDGVFSYTDIDKYTKEVVSTVAIVLLLIGSVMNPIIVLFLHSGIFNRMKILFTFKK